MSYWSLSSSQWIFLKQHLIWTKQQWQKQMFMMMEITMQGVFYGLGRTVPPAIVSIGCNYMRIPVALLLVHMGMGVDAIWWAVSGTTVAKGLILTAWFVLIKRKIL